ncbi:hypothetical protein TSUD_198240 [Trifolium subterraneum]|uniref:Eukaryotic translation initiation factor 6 n=1 Tax=Trifolium subterraneum TaxID=3900 RepID=A0A2Z6NXK7_TRISU|nr:hypothetical protein TSUD_198240 [Trifolium subterraneum]
MTNHQKQNRAVENEDPKTKQEGNKNGLLLPHTTTPEEWQHIRRSLPDGVVVAPIEEGLTSYGLFIACNDHVALAHADLRWERVFLLIMDKEMDNHLKYLTFDHNQEFKELITDVLGVEVFMPEESCRFYSGSYCALSNRGGLINPSASKKVLDELSEALEVPLVPGTVNRGSIAINPGMTVNDWTAFCGSSTTKAELCVIDRAFKLREP